MNLHRAFSKTLKDSEMLLSVYNTFYKIKNSKNFWKEQNRRESISFFNFQEVSRSMDFCPIERIKDSNYYGHAQALKLYGDYPIVNAAIEHGIYLGDRVSNAELLKTTHNVIAMSQNRIDSFNKNNCQKPVFAIGPYIHYAQPFYSLEEEKQIKSKIGRTLLVFPFHSALKERASFDLDLLTGKIEEIRGNFDSVMVCLHHNDIAMNPQFTVEYQKLGYLIVSAGHKFDFMFLPRLKSIIRLSDFVLSNSIGTQVGYCTYLEKPQIILRDEGSLSALNDSAYNEVSQRIAREQTMEIIDTFNETNGMCITTEQREVVDKYWGISMIKSRDELHNLLEELDKKQ